MDEKKHPLPLTGMEDSEKIFFFLPAIFDPISLRYLLVRRLTKKFPFPPKKRRKLLLTDLTIDQPDIWSTGI